MMDRFKSPFELSQKKKQQKELDQRYNNLVSKDSQVGAYKFDYSETLDLDHFVKMGNLDPKTAAIAKQVLLESDEENLGYCFLTFSHADEARKFILRHSLSFYNYTPVDVTLKSKLDHSVLDMKFFLNTARNDAQTVKEREQVRKARQELRDFEKEMNGYLPNRKKLEEFQRFALSLIENDKYN